MVEARDGEGERERVRVNDTGRGESAKLNSEGKINFTAESTTTPMSVGPMLGF